jgi:hypothetical protein
LYEASGLNPIEVHSTRAIGAVKLCFVVTGFLISSLKNCNLLAEGVEDREENM